MMNLNTLPLSMQSLPCDERGYPIPWFVAYVNGKPEFRAADGTKFVRAVKEGLCWVCGQKLGVYKTFVIGPMCGINRITAEPPCHNNCAQWSAINCPFLNNPRMIRREDEVVNNAQFVESCPGVGLTRNPGVTLLWTTRSYNLMRQPKGFLFQLEEPEKVEWYTQSRLASRVEVINAIKRGLPALRQIAATQGQAGLNELKKACDYLEANFLPHPTQAIDCVPDQKADLPLFG